MQQEKKRDHREREDHDRDHRYDRVVTEIKSKNRSAALAERRAYASEADVGDG
jgi:hypothetical protein